MVRTYLCVGCHSGLSNLSNFYKWDCPTRSEPMSKKQKFFLFIMRYWFHLQVGQSHLISWTVKQLSCSKLWMHCFYLNGTPYLWVAELLCFMKVAVQNSSEVLFAPVSPSRSMLLLALCCILCSRCRMEKLHTHMHCLLVKNNTAPVSRTYTCIHSVFCLFYSLTISDRFAGSVVIQVTGLCGCDCERDTVSFSIWYEWQQQLYVSLTVSSYAHTVCMQPY